MQYRYKTYSGRHNAKQLLEIQGRIQEFGKGRAVLSRPFLSLPLSLPLPL